MGDDEMQTANDDHDEQDEDAPRRHLTQNKRGSPTTL